MAYLDDWLSQIPIDENNDPYGLISKRLPTPIPIPVASPAGQDSTLNIPPSIPRGTLNIPPPGVAEGDYSRLAQQMPSRADFTPDWHHMIGEGQHPGILHSIANIGVGMATRDPTLSKNLAELPYNRAVSDWQTKLSALQEPVKSEQARTGLGLREQTEAERITADKAKEDELTRQHNLVHDLGEEHQKDLVYWRDKKISLETEKNQVDAAFKKGTLDERAWNDQMQRIDASIKEADSMYKSAEDRTNRIKVAQITSNTPTKEEYKDEKTSADNFIDTITKQYPDPTKVDPNSEEYRADLEAIKDPKIRAAVESGLAKKGYPAAVGPEISSQQRQAAQASGRTLLLISRLNKNLEQAKDHVGPIKGRMENGVLKLGSNKEEQAKYQALATDLTQLPIQEASQLGGGRSTGVLIQQLKQGSGSFSMGYPQLKEAIAEMERWAQERKFTSVTGSVDSPPDSNKIHGTVIK